MMDELPSFIGLGAPLATTLTVFWLVFRGTLVVRAQHETIVRLLEAEVARITQDRNDWKESSDRKGETNRILVTTNAKFIESAHFSDHVMTALQDKAEGGPHVQEA
jgi:hypothetical protein